MKICVFLIFLHYQSVYCLSFAEPLNVLFGALSFSVRFKELKAFLLRTGMAPPSWRLRRSRAAKSGGARAEEAQDPRLLVDTSSSSSSSDEDEDVGLQSVMGELMSVDKGSR